MCGALIMFQFGSVRPSFALTRGQRKKGKVTKRFEALEGAERQGDRNQVEKKQGLIANLRPLYFCIIENGTKLFVLFLSLTCGPRRSSSSSSSHLIPWRAATADARASNRCCRHVGEQPPLRPHRSADEQSPPPPPLPQPRRRATFAAANGRRWGMRKKMTCGSIRQ